MRTIKFRAKRIYNGEWVYGHYFEASSIHYIVQKEGNTQETYIIDESTLGQFTGQHDEKDNDVVEGDILHVDGLGNGEVLYLCGTFKVKLQHINYSLEEMKNSFTYHEVIGNVTDNKELLS